MGLAIGQISLLMLTQRKSSCEYDITMASTRKMALAREMSQLSSEYYSKLQSKQISYYDNGKYNKVNYGYLMGYGSNYWPMLDGTKPLKDNNSMILTDYNGRVVLSNDYANAIISVLGNSAMNNDGRGGTFSMNEIPAILATLCPIGNGEERVTAEDFEAIINGNYLSSSYDVNNRNTLTGNNTGETGTNDNSHKYSEQILKVVDFYLPIFLAAASNGWTTEYNQQMATNDDYVSDAISSGTLQLTNVNDIGNYEEGSLNYFITAGFVEANTSSDLREEVTAWYNAEKELINQKETEYDLLIEELSMELETIKSRIKSIESFTQDAISSVFDWGKG